MSFKDLTGNRYNRLKVLELQSIRHGTQRFYRCLCDCGNEIIVYGSRLTNNKVVSCGCYRKEKASQLKLINREGQRFGRLVVQSLDKISGNKSYWHCKCDCGNTKSIAGHSLKSGKTRSCGCIQKEYVREKARKLNTTHGKAYSKAYMCWGYMIYRCTNPNHKSYSEYGGRGITVCDRWLDFTNFYKDMGDPPTENHSIDRIDNNKGYYLENCRWATTKEQSNNRRNNHLLGIDGRSQTIGNWASELNINYQTLYYRVKHNLDPVTGERR